MRAREIKFRQFCEEEESVNYGMHEANPFHYALVRDGGWHTMQYTGLKDSKGLDIYESDIISDGNPDAVGVVSFSESEGAWLVSCESGSFFLYEAIGKKDCVIGNMYENPELLDISK